MGYKTFGPGPGKYNLPPTVGYSNHDPSKYRNPQFSMGLQLPPRGKELGPGPKYTVDKLTKYGKVSPPAYSIVSRPRQLTLFQTPGPGTYKNEQVPRMKEKRPPSYSMSWRHPGLPPFQTPGPDSYTLPTSLGPKVPDKNAKPAYSMSYKHGIQPKEKSPGPARYDGIETDYYKNKKPKYTMSPRLEPLKENFPKPGPADYYPRLDHGQGYSFGLRTDNQPMITPEDEMPCSNK